MRQTIIALNIKKMGMCLPMDACRNIERCATVSLEAISKRGWLYMIPKNTVSSHRLTHAKVHLNIAPRHEAVATLLRTGDFGMYV